MLDWLLKNRKALVVGIGNNIGKNIAIELAKAGASIVGADISEEACQNLQNTLADYPVQLSTYVLDISDKSSIESFCRNLSKDKNQIDILVNNVGIQIEKVDINELEMKDWHDTFYANLFGPVYLTKMIVQTMIKARREGCVIFTTSIHQFTPSRWASYSSSKAAIGMTIKELAIELSRYKIRVNGIAPGWVKEDKEGKGYPYSHCLIEKTSINPCYVGRTCVYLASDYFSRFTTGTVVVIDGGASLYSSRVALEMPE